MKNFLITTSLLFFFFATEAQNGEDTTGRRFIEMLTRSNGTWTGEATVWFSPDKPPATSKSILTNTMIMNGRYQLSEITMNATGPGKSFTGVRITGYDVIKKVFTRAMIGESPGSGSVAMEGPWDEATQSFAMPFKHIGKESNYKEVYTIVNENTEILEIYKADSKTGKEFKMLQVKWTRKK